MERATLEAAPENQVQQRDAMQRVSHQQMEATLSSYSDAAFIKN